MYCTSPRCSAVWPMQTDWRRAKARIPVPDVQVLSQVIADAHATPRLNDRVCGRIVRQRERPCQSDQAMAALSACLVIAVTAAWALCRYGVYRRHVAGRPH